MRIEHGTQHRTTFSLGRIEHRGGGPVSATGGPLSRACTTGSTRGNPRRPAPAGHFFFARRLRCRRTSSFADVMDRLRSGEDDAARDVFVRFARRLIGLARKHLDGRLAVKVDPEDVVQSAYKSFFVRHRDGRTGSRELGRAVGAADGHHPAKVCRPGRVLRGRASVTWPARWPAAGRTTRAPVAGPRSGPRPPAGRGGDPGGDGRGPVSIGGGRGRAGRTGTEPARILRRRRSGRNSGRAERSVRRLRERVRKRLERLRDDSG